MVSGRCADFVSTQIYAKTEIPVGGYRGEYRAFGGVFVRLYAFLGWLVRIYCRWEGLVESWQLRQALLERTDLKLLVSDNAWNISFFSRYHIHYFRTMKDVFVLYSCVLFPSTFFFVTFLNSTSNSGCHPWCSRIVGPNRQKIHPTSETDITYGDSKTYRKKNVFDPDFSIFPPF